MSLRALLQRFTTCNAVEREDAAPRVNIITYRLGKDMVYVPLASTYSEALLMAHKVFPRLAGIDSDQLCFTLTVTLRGQQFPVRISPMTWADIRDQVIQYEILDIAVADKVLWEGIEELRATSPSAQGPPPTYCESSCDPVEPKMGKTSLLVALSRLLQKNKQP